MNEDGLTIDMSGKALRLKVFFIQYTLWLSFTEHKMDVIKNGSLTRNKRKSVYADGGSLSIFSDGAAASGIFAYALDDETRDNEMVKLVYQRWTILVMYLF
jgi:hypothetical protein